MTIHKSKIFDKDGNRVITGIIPDGGRLRVPLVLMDSAPADLTAITERVLADAPDLARHRPGTLMLDGIKGEIAATEREVMRQHRLSALSDAWKHPVPLNAAKPAATTADAADPNAAADARDQRLRDAWVNA